MLTLSGFQDVRSCSSPCPCALDFQAESTKLQALLILLMQCDVFRPNTFFQSVGSGSEGDFKFAASRAGKDISEYSFLGCFSCPVSAHCECFALGQ